MHLAYFSVLTSFLHAYKNAGMYGIGFSVSIMAETKSVISALSFFQTVGKLKELKRTGWVNHGKIFQL